MSKLSKRSRPTSPQTDGTGRFASFPSSTRKRRCQSIRPWPQSCRPTEQEGLPSSDSIDELLGRLAWPDAVDGAAISLERVTLPPEAEAEIPDDAEEARRFVAADPRREDIRMVVGVLRSGESWCTIRLRSHDSQAEAISGADLVPEMIEALLATFAD